MEILSWAGKPCIVSCAYRGMNTPQKQLKESTTSKPWYPLDVATSPTTQRPGLIDKLKHCPAMLRHLGIVATVPQSRVYLRQDPAERAVNNLDRGGETTTLQTHWREFSQHSAKATEITNKVRFLIETRIPQPGELSRCQRPLGDEGRPMQKTERICDRQDKHALRGKWMCGACLKGAVQIG